MAHTRFCSVKNGDIAITLPQTPILYCAFGLRQISKGENVKKTKILRPDVPQPLTFLRVLFKINKKVCAKSAAKAPQRRKCRVRFYTE
jgi:hypothetical protein